MSRFINSTPARFALSTTLLLFGCADDAESAEAATDASSTSGTSTSGSATAKTSDATSPTSATTSSTTNDASTTDDGSTTTTTSSSSSSSSSETATESSSSTGGESSTGGLELEGDPPEAQSYAAIDGAEFELLPDDADFTDFGVDGNRLQVPPLRDANFPDDVNYCQAQSDEELNGIQQWARAQLQAQPKTWYYDVTITVVAEEDGESEFALAINGEVVEMFVAPNTAMTAGVEDMDDVTHTWSMIPIEDGDSIQVWGRAHSNGELEEAAGCRTWSPTYAWARGRWRQLDLAPTPGVG